MRLFAGYTDAYGVHGVEKPGGSGKKVEIKGTARTARGFVTLKLWEDHLAGQMALGIIPLKANDHCSWGVIDIDSYTVDHQDLVGRLEEAKIPMVVCRSKSGGAHIFAFLREEVSAEDLIDALRGVASYLGHGTSEIFPKQTHVLIEKGDLANWLNMPYFDAASTKRYGVGPGGKGMSLDVFLSYAEARLCTLDDLARRPVTRTSKKATPAERTEFGDGPPCLEHMAAHGIPEGGRNNALFNFGIFARRKFQDDWETKIESWNRDFMMPPLPAEEVHQVQKQVGKKDYNYRCKDNPLCNFCNASLCRTREFGVTGYSTPSISSIAILETQPPLFFVTMDDGGRVECSADEILNPRGFQKLALEQLKVVIPLYTAKDWLPHIQRCIDTATHIDAPAEASIDGHFYELVERFCTDRHAAREADEMLLGRPWTNVDEKRVYFRLRDLMSFLERERFRDLTRQQVTSRIKSYGGGQHFFNLRGKGVNTFWVPDLFSRQTEPHEVRGMDGSEV